MKKMLKSKLFIGLILIATFGFFINIDLVGQISQQPSQITQDIGNKQYVQVKLKNGEAMIFEYQSFIEMNLALQPDVTADVADAAKIGQTKTFGENRVLFIDKNTCQEYSISLDNLQEMELIGIAENKCTHKKDRLFKMYLLDLDKYEGFLKTAEFNLNIPLDQQGLKGQILNTADTKTLSYEDIATITFFAR